MEFLPIKLNNQNVYAGFGKRLGAGIVDGIVLIPFMVIFYFLESLSIASAMLAVVLSSFLYSAFVVYFHYKFGATPGKMSVGIKVTLPNGGKIGFKQAVLRSSVDLAFAAFLVVAQVAAISKVDPDLYLNAGWLGREEHLLPLFPAWYEFLNIALSAWYGSEFIVLLFNKRKRALHDFIAGTVVINETYADYTPRDESAGPLLFAKG